MDRQTVLVLLAALTLFIILGVLSYTPSSPLHGNVIIDWTMKGMVMAVCAFFYFGRYYRY